MTIRWYEGFEHHGTSLAALATAGWSAIDGLGDIRSDVKRTGTYSFEMSALGSFRRNIGGSLTETIVGIAFGFRCDGLPATTGKFVLCQVRALNSRSHISLQITPTGRLQIVRGGLDALSASGTTIATSANAIAAGTFNHIEVKVNIHDTDGYVYVRVNGRDFFSITGANTVGPSAISPYAVEVAFGTFDSSAAATFLTGAYFDDICVWDQVVDAEHDGNWIGQQGVIYLPVDQDGTHEEWLLSTGSDSFALLDEVTPDEDSTYIYSDALDQVTSLYCVDPPANIDTIKCLAIVCRARKTENGDADLALGTRSLAGTEEFNPDFPLTPNYYTYFSHFPVNPETSAPWSAAAMPQVMVKRTL